jgi:GNAT superfamily N-acetyltransferase
MLPLLQQDWEEVGDHTLPLEPDVDAYLNLEDSGIIKTFTARVDNKLVGYFVVICSPSLQSKNAKIATNDVIFVDKAYRKLLVGPRLFKFVERCLKEDGYERLYVATTEKHKIDDGLTRMGYRKIETRFEKVL